MKTRGKRILSLALCLVLVLALVPMQPIHAYQGSGTKNDPYLVSTYSDLRYLLAKTGDMYIRLTADIYNAENRNGYYLDVRSGRKVLDLCGWNISRAAMTQDENLFDVQGDLVIRNSNPDKTSEIRLDTGGRYGCLIGCRKGHSVTLGSELHDKIKLTCISTIYYPDEVCPEVDIRGGLTAFEGVTFPSGYCSLYAGPASVIRINGGTYPNGMDLAASGNVLVKQATIQGAYRYGSYCFSLPSSASLDPKSVKTQNGSPVPFLVDSSKVCYLLYNDTTTQITYTGGAIHWGDPEDQTVYADGESVAQFTATGLFATWYEWDLTDHLGQVYSWNEAKEHAIIQMRDHVLTIQPDKGDTWLSGKYVQCRYRNYPYQTDWTYSETAELTVITPNGNPSMIDTVIITGIDAPVVGQHPDFTFNIGYANDLGLQGSVDWVAFSKNGGNGVHMGASDVFQEGYRYNCNINIASMYGRCFVYRFMVDDYGDEYYVFDGTLTVNDDHTWGYITYGGTRLDTIWWGKEALPSGKTYDYYIDMVQITDQNKDDVFGDGKVTFYPKGELEEDSNVLVLDNYILYTNSGLGYHKYNKDGDIAAMYLGEDTTLVLYGDNYISGDEAYEGIVTGEDCKLDIRGSGTLNVDVGTENVAMVAPGGTITVRQQAEVELYGSNGLEMPYAGGNVTVKDDAKFYCFGYQRNNGYDGGGFIGKGITVQNHGVFTAVSEYNGEAITTWVEEYPSSVYDIKILKKGEYTSAYWSWDHQVHQPYLIQNGLNTTGGVGESECRYINITARTTDCGGDTSRCAISQFKDVPGYTNWAHKGIEYCVVKGLMSGTSATAFSPKTAMSRAMLVTVLYRMAGQPGAGTAKFSDVPANQWYSAAVSWAADHNIVSGVGGGKFDPNGNVTREQLAVILFRYANFQGYDTDATADYSTFPDASSVHSWASSGVQWAVAVGLLTGSTVNGKTYLSPQGNATREQVASILMRFCENVAR